MKSQLTLLLFLFILSNTSFTQGRYAPIGYYPEKYDAYGVEDWDTIKNEFDKILDYKSVNLRVVDSPNFLRDTKYFFAKIIDIPWNESQEDEIVSYLEYFTIIMNRNAEKYSKIFNRYNQKRPLYSYPTMAMWAILKLDVTEGLRVIDKLTKDLSPSLSITLISPYYKHNDFSYPLEKSIEGKQLTKKDIERVNELRFKHQLSKVKSQRKAWKRIILRNHLSNLDLTNNKVNIGYWYDANKLMRDIYGEININIILDLIKKMKPFEQKYSLLYSAGFFTNGKLSRRENIEPKTINRFLTLVEELCFNQNEFNLLDIDRTDTIPRLYNKIKNHSLTQNLNR